MYTLFIITNLSVTTHTNLQLSHTKAEIHCLECVCAIFVTVGGVSNVFGPW